MFVHRQGISIPTVLCIQLNLKCIKKKGIQKTIYVSFMSTQGQYKHTQIYMIGCIGCRNFHIIYQLIGIPSNKCTLLQHNIAVIYRVIYYTAEQKYLYTQQEILIIGELTAKKEVKMYMSFMIMHSMCILKCNSTRYIYNFFILFLDECTKYKWQSYKWCLSLKC